MILPFRRGATQFFSQARIYRIPKKKSHSHGTEASGKGLKSMVEKQKDSVVLEKDMNNKQLRTLKSMSVSKQWFSWAFTTWKRDNPLSVSNCSEAGILTDHCSLLTLNEGIYRFCKTKVNIPWMLKKALKRKSRH